MDCPADGGVRALTVRGHVQCSGLERSLDKRDKAHHGSNSPGGAPDAPPERVYAALTDGRKFQEIVLLSAAVHSGMVKPTQPAQISADPGGAFTIFGGFVTGRQIELVKNVRIVQAWRPGEWPAGVYSIARFELRKQGSGTLLVFDHTGFPAGAAGCLADGWKMNYWQPLSKFLESEGRRAQ